MSKTEEVDVESVLSNIRRYVVRIRHCKKVLADGYIQVAGEQIKLPPEAQTLLESKITELETAIQTEIQKLLVG